jgi:hypothetical protein
MKNCLQLQNELHDFIRQKLTSRSLQKQALNVLQDFQNESLYLENFQTKAKQLINVSLLPIVLSKKIEGNFKTLTQLSNLARSAVLMRLEEDEELRKFFEAGVDPLAQEIMRANPYFPCKHQWRFRADTITDPVGGSIKVIENNGGEPHGDSVISAGVKVVENILGLCLGQSGIRIAPYPDEQMMQVMIRRYRAATGKKDYPILGYLIWKDRHALAEAEARYAARQYPGLYGKEAIQFDPLDILDIKKTATKKGQVYYTLICKPQVNGRRRLVEIEIMRRLHGEPMQNLDLWQKFRQTNGRQLCSDGEETIWQRFITKLANQMVNPLTSYATDKKLDVILGNADFMQHFKIWEKMQDLAADRASADALSLTAKTKSMVQNGTARQFLQAVHPEAHMLRRKADGLYKGHANERGLGLSDEQIASLQRNRTSWVIKRSSLLGHSGIGVHIGHALALHELDYEDYMQLPRDILQQLTGQARTAFVTAWSSDPEAQKVMRTKIKDRVADLPEARRSRLEDEAWKVLITTSLDQPDCLVQKAANLHRTPTLLLHDDGGRPKLLESAMHFDLDPQSIGPTIYTFPTIRVSSVAKTNVAAGYGAQGVAISETVATNLLKLAKGTA